MKEIASIFVIGVFLICTVVIWMLYHKLFRVYYFNLGRGLFMEIGICLFASCIMTGLILRYWYMALIVVGIVAWVMFSKKK